MKLRSKIYLYSAVLFAVLLIVMNIAIYYAFSTMTMRGELRQAMAEATRIAQALRESAVPGAGTELLRAYVPAQGMVRIVAEDGRTLAAVTSSEEQQLSREPAVYLPRRAVFEHRVDGRVYALSAVPIIWPDGAVVSVQLTETLAPAVDTLRVLRLVLIAVTALALVPALASAGILGRLIMRPVTAMTSTMQAIRRSGRFRKLELEEAREDELTEMGRTFNGMIELLERNFIKQERFVSDASHELKTPITIIESYASLLERRGQTHPQFFRESVEAIRTEAARMKELTETLLLLAKGGEHWKAEVARHEASALTDRSVVAFREAYGRAVELRAEPPCYVYTDPHMLRQLLFIFLDNARKYSDGPIKVEVAADTEQVAIRIIDRGAGIPKEELPKVFDRFYRVDEARGREGGGAGLGLALAVELARAVSAEIGLDSTEGVGTVATIRLPTRPPASVPRGCMNVDPPSADKERGR
ncbi:HAMP domain-containing histidine kinase [Paenibacillus sp. IB182496]|uniref:histidine kinase n=1 Tax=Paenibacillus sabuli TaxID=2772509 RepID=A0A927BYB0_9BACL|nr:HAMP domain-containing sensor histidine kinase [Paenibacillus sabuli]MBD2847729.1 HAMP domain-containing histidine kinase [Paenibacillus sabuli]